MTRALTILNLKRLTYFRAVSIKHCLLIWLAVFLFLNNYSQALPAAPPLTIQLVKVDIPTCPGTTGTLIVAGVGGAPPYMYGINNRDFSGNNIFTQLQSGVYILTVKDNAGIAVSDTIDLSPVTVTPDTVVCAGSSVTLKASSIGSLYNWSPTATLSDPSSAVTIATPTVTTAYTVTSTIGTPALNLLTNPGFESGDNGFNFSYDPVTDSPFIPYSTLASINIISGGLYAVVHKSTDLSSNFYFDAAKKGFTDHTTGHGLMMVVNGYTHPGGENVPVWDELISGITPNTDYTFSYWFQNANSDIHVALLETTINNIVLSQTPGSSINPYSTPAVAGWTQVSYTWNSGNFTFADITLYNIASSIIGTSFALDDMVFAGPSSSCKVSRDVNVVVDSVTAYAGGPTVQIYEGQSVVLNGNATGNNLNISWLPDKAISNTNSSTPLVSPLTNQVYTMNVTSAKGCTATDTVSVIVLKVSRPVLPNAFTPNGDGVNDVFRIIPPLSVDIKYFNIFDRWGKQVFSTNNSNQGWDGRYNDTTEPNGNYIWVIEYFDPVKQSFVYLKGSVVLVR